MRWRSAGLTVGFVAVVGLGAAAPAAAQSRLDLVVTAGVSGENYDGNLASVTVPVVDSANDVGAAVGEFGLRGRWNLLSRTNSSLAASFDLGMRQFLASGFEIRDYSPRERSGRLDLQFLQRVGTFGTLRLTGEARGRAVEDRPPMPLFLLPGYSRYQGTAQFTLRPVDGVTFDIAASGETSDFRAPEGIAQINLLDRDSRALELGASWGDAWTVRFYGSLRHSDYPEQASFDPTDPYRRDRAVTLGGEWRYTSSFQAEVGVEGIVNRSNSRRPEYDAFSGRALIGIPLPWWEMGVNLFAVVTGKSYVSRTPFARLVPGEEADNASVVYLDVNRPLAPNLDASVRFGFSRGETDIGDAYVQRYGMSFFLNYRPYLR